MDALTPRNRHEIIDPASVAGWGIDANPDNDPSWPLRDRAGVASQQADWEHPAPQRARIEVLQSVEYDRRPAVFGTSSPPSGLSGAMRRAAFRYSESNWWHWLLLVGADRVNVLEGVVADVAAGHPPDYAAETGLAAAWTHDRAGVIKRVAGVAAAVGVATILLTSGKRSAGPMPDRRRLKRVHGRD